MTNQYMGVVPSTFQVVYIILIPVCFGMRAFGECHAWPRRLWKEKQPKSFLTAVGRRQKLRLRGGSARSRCESSMS